TNVAGPCGIGVVRAIQIGEGVSAPRAGGGMLDATTATAMTNQRIARISVDMVFTPARGFPVHQGQRWVARQPKSIHFSWCPTSTSALMPADGAVPMSVLAAANSLLMPSASSL